MFSKLRKTLKITWEIVQYVVIATQKYLDRKLGLHEDQSYSFMEVLKGGVKG